MRPKQRIGHRVTYLAVSGLALTLVALFVAWFLDNFEPRGVEVEVGYSARPDVTPSSPPSARRRLRAMWLSPSMTRSLLDLPRPGCPGRQRDGATQRGTPPRPGDWIQAGGVLVMAWLETTEGAAPRPDDFLGGLGMRLRETAPLRKGRERARIELEIAARGEERPFVVSAPADRYLEDTQGRAQAAVMASDGRLRLIEFPLGNGQVTVERGQPIPDQHRHRRPRPRSIPQPSSPHRRTKRQVWLLYDSAEVPALARDPAAGRPPGTCRPCAPWSWSSPGTWAGARPIACRSHSARDVTCWSTWRPAPTSSGARVEPPYSAPPPQTG